ncbi:gamma-glutamylcyclotransferase family protein [Metaplanococcus flavidus]|uniref:Gamma-glutamylcyclotransferase n=1 Tax=Metaplanococcus flavidus TaxID=569883 RepID=A0ABW3LBM3_9BACL
MLLFVYGTLKTGGKYHFYLEEASLKAEQAVAAGSLYDTGLGYPAMRLDGTDQIHGEVYEIPEVLWPAIDFLEDCTGDEATDLYEKAVIPVEVNGEVLEATVYLAKDKELLKTKISGGVWDIAYV